tara:strand:+ start:5370 stop:5945 length:576 start_codon:yes stop_codon:yes gene_type:complete
MNKLEVIREAVKLALEVDITINSRQRHTVLSRQVYYKLCRDLTNSSLDSIGKAVNRYHATVMYGLRNFDADVLHLHKYNITYKNLAITLADKFDENYQVGEAATIADLLEQLEVEKVKNQIGTILAPDEQNILDLWRSLSATSKEATLFKIESALKIQKTMQPEPCTNPHCVDGFVGERYGEKLYCRTCKH